MSRWRRALPGYQVNKGSDLFDPLSASDLGCETCAGEGFVMVELLFLPSVYTPCPTCHGARYNAKTLEIKYRDRSIADVLGMRVDAAWEFFADERLCSFIRLGVWDRLT